MKVFTVGLDQKAPIDQTKIPDVPPPGYPGGEKSPSTTLPMGPEATPIFVKKSKGYKGVLVCMLAVFLIGLFALTLSEIAYNRQRDENFFRLRWAELKHKMGYDYANAAERIYTLRRQQEIEQAPIVPQNLQSPSTTTTTVNSPIIDSSVEKESNQDNDETPAASTMNQRLSFFKKLLEGIKKHAEDMGFDGTMQVSVLQVDPDTLQQQLRERLQQARNHESSDESSNSNMDGFGEWAMPQALLQQQQQQNENNNNRFGGGFRFDDDYSGDFEAAAQQAREQQERQQRFRGFGNQWQPQSFDHWTANRVETPFFPPRPFWWQQQQQQQRPQTPFFFQQGPMPQQQQQQSFIQNEMFQQQQVPQQLQQQQQQFPQHLQFPQNQEPQVIFFPDHNINQFQQQQQVPPQQQQLPEMNMFQHPRENAFIPPEDRIQIEPPSTPEQLNRWRMNNQKPFDFKSNEGPRGWTHQSQQQQENQDAFVQPPPPQPQPQAAAAAAAAVMTPPLRFGPAFSVPQQNALPANGVPIEPKKWENAQPLPAISIDSVSEPLPSWAIGNSLESETPFAEIAQDEENLSHELSQNSIIASGDAAAAIPRPPSIQPDENESHLHILPIKEVEGEKEHSGEVKSTDEKAPINDEPEVPAVVAKEPEPIEVDFPAVKFPISDDADRQQQNRDNMFFQVDDPIPSQIE
uniref:Uncharacterized protein n=1 Tax=Panagrolaimus sp. PS1159 TaxID=55785 RepID=A0AC35EYS3_9BILA